jgi:hypothetical protein
LFSPAANSDDCGVSGRRHDHPVGRLEDVTMTHARRLAVIALSMAAVLLTPSTAFAGWTDHVAYKRERSFCSNDGQTVTIGASVFQKEFGRHGVRQMRVQFLLYDHDPRGPGIDVADLRKTKSSSRFPNDARNFWWNGAKGGAVQTWKVNAGPDWHLVAKLTWDRGLRRDWNVKIPVAVCS